MIQKKHLPICLGVFAAGILVLLLTFGVLENWSPMGKSYWFDHFTLPRCGLAIRNQTNLFTSSQDYQHYGYHAITWESQPTLCLILGTPLSFLSPMASLLTATTIYVLIQIFLIVLFGRHLFREKVPEVKDYIFFFFAGFFFPWYLMLVLGQYHAISVLAVGLVLYSCDNNKKYKTESLGFILSAISKPVLAPLSILLLIQRKWKIIFIISFFCLLAYLPWLLLYFDGNQELRFGLNENYINAIKRNSSFANFTVPNWNQEMGVAKVIEFFGWAEHSFNIRVTLFSIICAVVSVLLLLKKRVLASYSVMVLWFFLYYSRGHEYHLTLYLPIFLALYCKSPNKYRSWPFVMLFVFTAIPTVFPVYRYFNLLPDPHSAWLTQMYGANEIVFYLYLFHKPTIPFLLILFIIYKEYSGEKAKGFFEVKKKTVL